MIDGKILPSSMAVETLKKGGTGCVTFLKDAQQIPGGKIPVILSGKRDGSSANEGYASLIGGRARDQSAIAALCMNAFGPVSGASFKNAMKGIVELFLNE